MRDSRKTMAEVFLPLYTLSTLILLRVLIPNPNFAAVLRPPNGATATITPFEHWPLHGNHTVAVLAAPNGTAATREFLAAVNELWTNLTVPVDVTEHQRGKLEFGEMRRKQTANADAAAADDVADDDDDVGVGWDGGGANEKEQRQRAKENVRRLATRTAPLPIRWQMFETLDELLAAYWRKPWAMPLAVVFHGADPMRGRLSYEVYKDLQFE